MMIFGSIIVVLGFAFFVGRILNAPQDASGNPDVSLTTAKELSERDSDNDGLPDWEEFLWKLDPQNPDTNNDGVLDGQEVEKRRAELKSDDLYGNTPNTQTDALARQFYLFAAANPNPSKSDIDSFLASIIDVLTLVDTVSYVEEADIVVGIENPGQYYQNLSVALFDLRQGVKPADLVIIDRFVGGQADSRQDMVDLIQIYNNTARDLKTLEVPPSILVQHVSLINSILNISGALQSILVNHENDPALAISSIGVYESASEEFTEVMENLTLYFQSNGII